ncbi:hypothetical protein [Aeromonas phage Riv-10]|nr:hypothetical protein [Aeromonas phage L9-6]APU02148.1 hypothetical protein [Aeromonas phage Riv-10]
MIFEIDSEKGIEAKAKFLENLKWCADDLDRKTTFRMLSNVIGHEEARRYANGHGLHNSYYFS